MTHATAANKIIGVPILSTTTRELLHLWDATAVPSWIRGRRRMTPDMIIDHEKVDVIFQYDDHLAQRN